MDTEVQIEDILAAQDVIKQFNRLDLAKVKLFKDGKPIDVDPEVVREFKFVGLNNSNFVCDGFYMETSGFLNRELSKLGDSGVFELVNEEIDEV